MSTAASSVKASYDPKPYYNPDAIAITVSSEPEESPEFRSIQEDISDYNYPEKIPGLSLHDSRMRRFHDCLVSAIEKHYTLRLNVMTGTPEYRMNAVGYGFLPWVIHTTN